jgi:23S rRNA (cytosine1962-C5)-methyltransferase
MAGGAERVLNLDLAKSALEWGRANYGINGLGADSHDFVYGDVFDWLARLGRRRELFDLVILDPPGYSRSKKRRFSVAHDLSDLVATAAQSVAPDGLLMVCSNVAELPRRSFRDRVLAGVAAGGRASEVIGTYHEPELDYPASPNTEPYLKQMWLRLGRQ